MTIQHDITTNANPPAGGGGLGDISSMLSGTLAQLSALSGAGVGLPGIQGIGSLISGMASQITGAGGTTDVANTISGLGSQLSSLTSLSGASGLVSSLTSQLSSLTGMLNLTGLSQVLHTHVLDPTKGIISSAFMGQHKTTWDQQGVTHTSSTAVTSTAPQIPHNGKTLVSDTLNVTLGIFGQAFGLISDRRLKSNIQDHPPVLDDVMRLKLKTFDVKSVDWETGDMLSRTPKHSLGYIAQDVQEVFPQLVKLEGKFLTLESDKFAPLVIAAFQEYVTEARREIAALKAEIAELKLP